MAKPLYASYIEFVPVKGKANDLLQAMLDAAAAFTDDAGCLQYVAGIAGNGNVGVWEIWTSANAHEHSLMDPETRAFIKQTMPMIKEIVPARILDLHGGRGLPS